MNRSIVAIALAPLLACGAAGAQSPMTEFEVRALLDAEGFSRVDDVDFHERRGLWEAEVITIDGEELELQVDPLTGRILFHDGAPYIATVPAATRVITVPSTTRVVTVPPTTRVVTVPSTTRVVTVPLPIRVPIPAGPLNTADVEMILADAGFNDVHDIEFDDGRWRAEARDATGEDYEVELDPVDGRIVHLEDD